MFRLKSDFWCVNKNIFIFNWFRVLHVKTKIKMISYNYANLFNLLCIIIVFVLSATTFSTNNVCQARAVTKRKLTKLLEIIEDDDDVRVVRNQNSQSCGNVPPTVLTEVLGSAYNSRYMSIDEPIQYEEDILNDDTTYQYSTSKRKTDAYQPFYVDDKYALELSNKPAWEVKHTATKSDVLLDTQQETKRARRDSKNIAVQNADDDIEINVDRNKRATNRRGGISSKIRNGERPWECEAKIKWIDLGPDYFPRFLRTVECTKHVCWYGHFTCKPRSFTVKILRRRSGECVPSESLRKIGTDGLPGDLRELWVWEERAVNFCCDCSA